MNYCETCKSIMVHDSCSNKRCSKHDKSVKFATFDQIEYIKDLLLKAEEPEEKYNFREMSMDDASTLIDELRAKLELGG